MFLLAVMLIFMSCHRKTHQILQNLSQDDPVPATALLLKRDSLEQEERLKYGDFLELEIDEQDSILLKKHGIESTILRNYDPNAVWRIDEVISRLRQKYGEGKELEDNIIKVRNQIQRIMETSHTSNFTEFIDCYLQLVMNKIDEGVPEFDRDNPRWGCEF